MKTVKIEIEVEVPDNFKWVAIDSNGYAFGYIQKPTSEAQAWGGEIIEIITNWRDTLTELRER